MKDTWPGANIRLPLPRASLKKSATGTRGGVLQVGSATGTREGSATGTIVRECYRYEGQFSWRID